MTLLAPEPRPATTTVPSADPALDADATPRATTDLDVVTATLLTWWDRLPRGRRDQLLSLQADEVLPRSVATELQHLGVDCPLTLVAEGGRLVRRALPPPALVELLAAHRAH